jgi:hypothetical protein
VDRENWAGQGLVVLMGHPRSGTTFLGRFLGAHPEVAYWEEPELLGSMGRIHDTLVRLYRHLAVDAGLDTTPLFRVSTREQVDLTDEKREAADRLALSQTREVAHRMQDEFLRRAGKRILLEKTPGQTLPIDQLRELLPSAKVIHIIRDPRDVASSTLRWIQREGWPPWLAAADDPLAVMADQWVEQVQDGLDAATGNQPMFTLRHEDLVASPAGLSQELCQFLGIRWSSRLDDFLARGFDTGIDPTTVGVWRDELTDAQVATVTERAGELMLALGYLDERERTTATERGSRRLARASQRLFGVARAERRPPAAS